MFMPNKYGLCVLAIVASAINASGVFADKISIGFAEVGTSAVRAIAPSGETAKACDALEKIYGVEDGYRGCTQGTGTSMSVMMTKRIYINRLWNKMVAAGDAGYESSRAFFYYNQTAYNANYKFFGKVLFDDSRKLSATYDTQGGRSQFIVGYMISLHKACTIDSSGIVKATKTAKIKATALDRKTRKGDYFQYHYTVNGGDGTDILGISASILPGKWPFFNQCEAGIYVNYGDEPEAE